MKDNVLKLEGFDRLFPLVGGRNQYQWILLGIVSLQTALLAFHPLGYVFLGAIPEHWCEIKELQNSNWTLDQIKNISIPRKPGGTDFEKCERFDLDYSNLLQNENYADAYTSINFDEVRRSPCTKWTYDKSIYESTVATQFDLVCGRKYLVATIQATFMAGALIGSFAMGGLSDGILGRRRFTLATIILVLIGGFGAAFSTSYMTFVICRFIIALGVAPSIQNCFTLSLEYSDASFRALMGMLQFISYAIGYMVMPVYAYYIRDWSTLQLAFTASGLILLSYFWILPESSRWLISRGREEEALEILQGIARRNKKPELDREVVMEIFEACKEQGDFYLPANTNLLKLSFPTRIWNGWTNFIGKYLHLVRRPELRKRSIMLWILFVSVSFIYYGISFGSATLTNDPFLLVFLGGLMEIPGLLGVVPLVAKFGRTLTSAMSFLLAGVSIIAISFTPHDLPMLRVIFAMSGKLFISGCYGAVYVMGAELYPTETRATGLGCASLIGRTGSILAPFIVNQMNDVYTDLPSIIFGVTGIFAGLVAFSLPETRDAELLESVNVIEVIRTRKKSGSQENPAYIPDKRDNELNSLENGKQNKTSIEV